MGSKITSFRDSEKLINVVAQFLNEGAAEVRNIGKNGLILLKNSFPNSRDLDNLLMRSINNDRLFEKCK